MHQETNSCKNSKNKNLSIEPFYPRVAIYCIQYITMKDSDYVKIKSVNLLYLIINEVDGHFEEKKWK